jgi:hypothetical protein
MPRIKTARMMTGYRREFIDSGPLSIDVQLPKYAWIHYEHKLESMGFRRGINTQRKEKSIGDMLKFFNKKSKAIKQTMLKQHGLYK